MKLPSNEKTGNFFVTATAFAAVLLSLTIPIGNGTLSSNGGDVVAMILLTLALLSCFVAVIFSRAQVAPFSGVPLLRILARTSAFTLLCAGCGFQFLMLMIRYRSVAPLFLVGAATALATCFFLKENRARWTWTSAILALALLAIFVVCAAAVLRLTAGDVSDVLVVQRDAADALLAGHNPYTLTFPNIYGAADSRLFYGAGTVVDGRVKYGFPYPPLTLFWILPAQFFLSDFRYGYLLALALSAAFLVMLRPSRVTLAAAVLLVFSAPAFFVLQIGWTEPFSVMMLCAAIWMVMRQARGSRIALGLLAVSKQYFVLVLPLMFLLPLPRGASTRAAHWKSLALAAATASVIVLPFLLWNARALWDSLVTLQLHQPFRTDALNYAAFIKQTSGLQIPSFVGFGAAALTFIFCLRRAPRTVAGFAVSTAFTYLSFFAFGKQAFANYYYFVLAALCCAAAAAHCENSANCETAPS